MKVTNRWGSIPEGIHLSKFNYAKSVNDLKFAFRQALETRLARSVT
jgi:hypothetical protein